MGNCCSNLKNSSSNRQPHPEPSQAQSIPSQKYIKIISKSLNFSYKLEYSASKSLRSYINYLVLAHPELLSESLFITKNNEEIHNFSESLKDLEIFPSDTLSIEIKEDRILDVSVSREEIAEEESTTNPNVFKAGFQFKRRFHSESTGDATKLWKSAKLEVKFNKVTAEDSEENSIYPLDNTVEKQGTPEFGTFELANGQSVMMESDDSYSRNSIGVKNLSAKHPNDFFKDIQGPFSVLKLFS